MKESVRRAESNIGRSSYDLLQDNCQHFAIWCRTGIADSGQSHLCGPSNYKIPAARGVSKDFSKVEVSEYFVKALLTLYNSDKDALMPDWLGHGFSISRLKTNDYKAY
ncbi:hypothetical protein HB662_13035 [Roseomonas frigidaquae]|uniref:LRAT domain-containing protein n=1 Tax=Falsiroseomonas frigidaquae TaxID=487318 RepID=A0ABX1F059_9PROT|nr:hypothetical protein [Falsiroseomonas frigidaquae]